MEPILELPYKPLRKLANRDQIREIGKKGRETIFISFDKIKIREGFNVRTVYSGIEELAESIAVNGLTPLVVDVTGVGQVFLEEGHRRYKALTLLSEQKRLKKLQLEGIRDGFVECFCNKVAKTELQRIKGLFISNSGEPLTYKEKTAVVERLKTHYDLSNQEIGDQLGLSRQTVDNMLLLASAPESVRDAVQRGEIKPTAAVALIRKTTSDDEILPFLTQYGPGGQITQSIVTSYFGAKREEPTQWKEAPKQQDEMNVPEDTANRTGEDPLASFKQQVKDFEEGIEEQIHQHNEDIRVMGYDDDPEENSHKTSSKAPPVQKPKTEREAIDDVKEETIWCSDVIKDLDWIDNTITNSKLPKQTKDDIISRINFATKKLDSIREFTKKAKLPD